MEQRLISGIPLSIFTDELMNISFVRVLTKDSVESYKIPTHIDNYKYKHFLNPLFFLEVEIIKTRKNWIFKHIHNYKNLRKIKTYEEALNQSEVVKMILKYVQEDQETNILDFVLDFFQNGDLVEGIVDFEVQLLEKLGFIPEKCNTLNNQNRVRIGKEGNELV
jgi:hypothetical protein